MKIRTPIRGLRVVEKRKTYIPHLLFVALVWVASMNEDYAIEAAQEAERAARIDAEHTACLRGEWRAVTQEGVEIGCMPVQTNHPRKQS